MIRGLDVLLFSVLRGLSEAREGARRSETLIVVEVTEVVGMGGPREGLHLGLGCLGEASLGALPTPLGA